MKLLILGGTADARYFAQAIHDSCPALELIYSVAGLVRLPKVPAQVISGGFTQHGGLEAYCKAHDITAIANLTHPFSSHMGRIAQQACDKLDLQYWRFLRPQWQQQKGDDWRLFEQRDELLEAVVNYSRIALTLGQVSQAELNTLSQSQVWLRTAVAPGFALPKNTTWIKAIGPFSQDGEHTLFEQHRIQALVSKNSGGQATEAKLAAARSLNIPVFMLQRPTVTGPVEENFDALVEQVAHWSKQT